MVPADMIPLFASHWARHHVALRRRQHRKHERNAIAIRKGRSCYTRVRRHFSFRSTLDNTQETISTVGGAGRRAVVGQKVEYKDRFIWLLFSKKHAWSVGSAPPL